MIRIKTDVKRTITIDLTETEALALEAIAGYNPKEVLTALYSHLGKHYISPYGEGVLSLFNKLKGTKIRKALDTIEVGEKVIDV